MNNKWIYYGIAAVGVCLMIAGWVGAGFSFGNLFADKAAYTQVTKTETLGEHDTVEISTDVEIIRVGRSGDGDAHISYEDSEKKMHSYAYAGGVLSIGIDDAGRKWYDYINFSFAPLHEKAIEVLLPASFHGTLHIAEATGDMTVEQLAGLDQIDLTVSTGDLRVTDCGAETVRLTTSTGALNVSNLTAGTLDAASTTGRIALDGLTVGALAARFTTGSAAIANADCGSMDVRGTTGGIALDGVVAEDMTLRASTGDITGNIDCPASDFTVESSTATGRNNLQNGGGGARKLRVSTTTGDINLTFAD